MPTLTDLARRLKLPLVAMTDERRGGDPLELAGRLPPGAMMVFRHYDAPGRAALAVKLSALCRQRRIPLLIAGDFALALRLRAGLHLPDHMARGASPKIRLWRRRGGLLTAAAHDRLGLSRAARLGARTALLSPVFPTASHPGAKPLGLLAFRRLVRYAALPVTALGGIDRTRILALKEIRLYAVAAVGGLISPD